MTTVGSAFLSTENPVCPAGLLMAAQALKCPKVAVAGAGAALPMEAAQQACAAGVMTPILVGATQDIHTQATRINWDLTGIQIMDAKDEASAAQAAVKLCADGQADVLMKGQVHTDAFLRAVLVRDGGLRTDRRLMHFSYISPPKGGDALLLSDVAVNVAPDVNLRRDMTRTAVNLLHILGNPTPKIAFLSATESVNPSGPSSGEAHALATWASANIDNAEFSGPLALDLVLSAQAVQNKGLSGDPVAGRADAIIVPDIVVGNAIFKSLVYLAGGCAAGIVLGAKVPLLLTSRADPAEARLASVALAAIVAARKKPGAGMKT